MSLTRPVRVLRGWARSPHLPPRTVRMRLTLLYGTLFLLSVDARDDSEVGEVVLPRRHWTHRAERVETLCARPLTVFFLEITRSDIVDRQNSRDCSLRIVFVRTSESAAAMTGSRSAPNHDTEDRTDSVSIQARRRWISRTSTSRSSTVAAPS